MQKFNIRTAQNGMNVMISVVVVTWNNEKDIEICLTSILSQDFKSKYNVIVVDNASTDSTVSIIEQNFKNKVILLKNKKNVFLTGGNNIGIMYAWENFNPEYVMVLNPDTKVEKNLISELYRIIDANNKIGAVGPKVKFFRNKNEGLINSAGIFYDSFKQAYDVGFMEEDKEQFNAVKEVWGVSGVCILYRSEMLKQIGLYWERIKMHLDEVELFIRAHKKGWIVKYVPSTTVWHSYMQSTEQSKVYKIDKFKKKVWLLIALRHYSIKSKLAMLKNYIIRE